MFEAVTVGEVEAGRAAKVKQSLENLIHSLQKNTFDVAELLHEVKSKHYYSSWGFDTFKEYVNNLDIKSRKAQYLVRIVDVMNEVSIPRETYEPVGLSKLREITSLEPKETYTNKETGAITPLSEFITAFVEKGKEMSLDDLKEHVRTLKGLTDENELVWLNFCLKKSVRDDVVKPALELAKANIGSVGKDEEGYSLDASDGRALEMVAIEYLNDPANRPLEAPIE